MITNEQQENSMKMYVAGILRNATEDQVLLMQKKRPAWQAGRFNFPGGRIEEGETALDAVVREIEEECGIYISPDRWTKVADIVREGVEVLFFVATVRTTDAAVQSITDEPVSWHRADTLPDNTVENVRWLIPFVEDVARHDHVLSLKVVEKPKVG